MSTDTIPCELCGAPVSKDWLATGLCGWCDDLFARITSTPSAAHKILDRLDFKNAMEADPAEPGELDPKWREFLIRREAPVLAAGIRAVSALIESSGGVFYGSEKPIDGRSEWWAEMLAGGWHEERLQDFSAALEALKRIEQ